MEELSTILRTCIEQNTWIQATLSQARNKHPEQEQVTKVTIKPIELKEELFYQFSYFFGTQVKHENLPSTEALERTEQLIQHSYRQALVQTVEADYQVLVSKKGKVTILKKKPTKTKVDVAHNRQKKYIIEEGQVVPFLVELGVMSQEGKIIRKKYDKYKQINRFLEMIRDVVPHLPKNRTVQIVDFGCGKSYLTFALYHYLVLEEGLDVSITGLDLKADVIRHCNQLAIDFGYQHLQFEVGDIAQYQGQTQVDMVVTLHACDTATDAALEKAVRWGAEIILSVPCCQHELATQLENQLLQPMLSHGIIKERFASLATDSIRAQLLSILGYKTQMLEFIDVEHTPKNILIRAIKEKQTSAKRQQKLIEEYVAFRDFLQVQPYLEKALQDKLAPLE